MKRAMTILLMSGMALALPAASGFAQIHPNPYVAFWGDTTYTTSFNGQLVPVGSVVTAYDQSNVLCGIDTVRISGSYGYISIYGDDPNSVLDEGLVGGEKIKFRINGRPATYQSGDSIWQHLAVREDVPLAVSGATVAMSAVELPKDRQSMPGETVQFRAKIRNDGDGLDFYGVRLSLSIPDDGTQFGWKAFEPDSVVYAGANQIVNVYFSVQVALFSMDTAQTVSYKIFSHLDTTVNIQNSVKIYLTITDVPGDDGGILPNTFTLYQNYPNPFNPSTTIAFVLPRSSSARLEVYDILGREVEMRDLGTLPSGEHRIAYDASALASGVYLYRVVTDDVALSRKMVLVK